jgi:hypothetical protein
MHSLRLERSFKVLRLTSISHKLERQTQKKRKSLLGPLEWHFIAYFLHNYNNYLNKQNK